MFRVSNELLSRQWVRAAQRPQLSPWYECEILAAGIIVQLHVPLLQGVHGMWELCISKARHANVEEERLEAVVASLHSPHTLVRPWHLQSGWCSMTWPAILVHPILK